MARVRVASGIVLLAFAVAPVYAQQPRAPAGGMYVNGHFYKGGQFIPSGPVGGYGGFGGSAFGIDPFGESADMPGRRTVRRKAGDILHPDRSSLADLDDIASLKAVRSRFNLKVEACVSERHLNILISFNDDISVSRACQLQQPCDREEVLIEETAMCCLDAGELSRIENTGPGGR